MNNKKTYYYDPNIFNVSNIAEAMRIILTANEVKAVEQRWEKETQFLVNDIGDYFSPTEKSFILDYGCGIGRISKKLIEDYDCFIVGVDISESMRELAVNYVNNEKFSAVSREELLELIRQGFRFDYCLSIWVLQHCPQVIEDINLIKTALKREGLLYILNNYCSAVPTNHGWVNDGVDVFKLLIDHFNEVEHGHLPYSVAEKRLCDLTYISRMVNNKAYEKNIFSFIDNRPANN